MVGAANVRGLPQVPVEHCRPPLNSPDAAVNAVKRTI
jgi:hypothetical protein